MFSIPTEEDSEVSSGNAGLENRGICREKEESRTGKERAAWTAVNTETGECR